MPKHKRWPWRHWWSLAWQRRWWIALATLFILVWWLVPPLLYRHTGTGKAEKLKAITDTRTALLAGLIGVGALLTFWLNRRVYQITERTLKVTEQGQITERFNKAIEHLGEEGDDKTDVRLGAIYALGRIAENSKDDREAIAEILTAYVRSHAPWPPSRRGQPQEDQPINEVPDLRPRAPDVQAVLTLLGRAERDETEPPLLLYDVDLRNAGLVNAHLERADLRRAHLEGADLRDAHLDGADLRDAHLREAKNLDSAHLKEAKNLLSVHLEAVYLQYAHLEEADFQSAHLEGADLQRAQLKAVNFRDAHLDGTDLRRAHLEEADFQSAHLDGADLRDAHLKKAKNLGHAHLKDAKLGGARLDGADLRDAHLEEADLRHAHLEEADLRHARLDGADLRSARLDGADLRYAHLEEADLRYAYLEKADFQSARLDGADLRDTHLDGVKNLDRARLTGARRNAETTGPVGFNWEAAEVRLSEED